jgi:hypothetical protein
MPNASTARVAAAQLPRRLGAACCPQEAFVKGAGPNGERIYQIPTWVTVVLADDGSKNADIPDAVVKRQLQVRRGPARPRGRQPGSGRRPQ